jgi:hypothetical protein
MKNKFKLLKPSDAMISEIENVVAEYQNKYAKAYEKHERIISIYENTQ